MGFAREVATRVMFMDEGTLWRKPHRRNSSPTLKMSV